jgi:ATP-dependent Clp protease protease subunit
MMREWYRLRASTRAAYVWMCGDIGRMHHDDDTQTPADFVRDLRNLPRSVDTIGVYLASGGGNCAAGITIAYALRHQRLGYGRRVHVHIQEMAASVASLIMCAADRITIADDALIGLHDPILAPTPQSFSRCRTSMIEIYRWACRKPEAEIGEMLTHRLWMTAAEAVQAGFADAIIAGPHHPVPFWSDSGVAAHLPPDALASVQAPAANP